MLVAGAREFVQCACVRAEGLTVSIVGDRVGTIVAEAIGGVDKLH